MEPEEDVRSPLKPARVGRAVALIGASILAIGIATFSYAQPKLAAGSAKPRITAKVPVASYRLSGLDFIDPTTGWVVAELPSHDFAVLRTTNAGRSWTRQLTGPAGDIGEYAKFFDARHGILVLLGPHAVVFQTDDGGRTWKREDVQQGGGHVISAQFLDARHGWLLIQAEPDPRGVTSESLFRTSDGGATWVDLGNPVVAGDWAFQAVFASARQGWLYSRSGAGYAYGTDDGGASWRQVLLPAPRGGWPVAPPGAITQEQFFVAARPTSGSGVVAIVVPIAPPQGRSADGSVLVGYPPLTLRAFDGGGSIIYEYQTLVDAGSYRYWSIGSVAKPGYSSAAPEADQVKLSSADAGATWRAIASPASGGAVAFAGALDWWWVGAGAWATTSDGGVTWRQTRNPGMPEPLPGSLQILDPDHAWFATTVGGKPLLEVTGDGGHEWSAVSLPPIAIP